MERPRKHSFVACITDIHFGKRHAIRGFLVEAIQSEEELKALHNSGARGSRIATSHRKSS
jgi:hypothetical protein